MNELLPLWTDVASLCLFDPIAFVGITPPSNFPFHKNSLVHDGEITLVHLPGDGTFRVRLAFDSVSAEEAPLIYDSVTNQGLKVTSNQIYISGMDLPGDELTTYQMHGAGTLVAIPNGFYQVDVHALQVWDDPEAAQYADYVVVLRKRTECFVPVIVTPQFNRIPDLPFS